MLTVVIYFVFSHFNLFLFYVYSLLWTSLLFTYYLLIYLIGYSIYFLFHNLYAVNERTRKQIQSRHFRSGHFGSNKSKPSNSRINSNSRVNNSVSKTKVGPDSSPKSSIKGTTEMCNFSDRKVNLSARFANSLSPLRRAVDVMSGLNDSEELSNGVDDIEKNTVVETRQEDEGNLIFLQTSDQCGSIDSESPNKDSSARIFPNSIIDHDILAMSSL